MKILAAALYTRYAATVKTPSFQVKKAIATNLLPVHLCMAGQQVPCFGTFLLVRVHGTQEKGRR